MLQSQGFLGSQVPDMFEPKVKDSWEVYSQFAKNIRKRAGADKFEAVIV